jgi:hypothetical protein
MDLRPTNDNQNRLRAGSVSDLVCSFFPSPRTRFFKGAGQVSDRGWTSRLDILDIGFSSPASSPIFRPTVKRKLIFCHYWGRRVSGPALETGTIDYEHRVRSEETRASFV